MKFKVLTEENFILFAMKHYDNPSCEDADEFYSDLNRIKYIKRLIRKYLNGEELKERLLLNHLIIFFNVFGIQSAKRMIFFRFEEEYHSILKTFLVYLNYIKDNETIDSIELVRIPINTTVANVLREIK
jgi:hypothetical protein|tara:strand:+ start:161 stop:547 length:387 start_codon:yes stop_codon:yes gene_type:complete